MIEKTTWIRIITPEESKSTKKTSWIEPNMDSNCGYIENNSKSNSRKRIHIFLIYICNRKMFIFTLQQFQIVFNGNSMSF